jgi:hypothetical protein
MSMLKITARIFLILAAALLVVGATVAFSHTSLGAQVLSLRGGLEDGFRNATAGVGQISTNFAPQAGFPAGGRGGDFDQAGSGSLVFSLVRNLGVVGAIVLVYVAISLSLSHLKGWLKGKRSPLRPAAG